jgi:chaperone required for assembly of F1-ATPase
MALLYVGERVLKTPAQHPLEMPQGLAERLAQAIMRKAPEKDLLLRLVHTAIDRVRAHPDAVLNEIFEYAQTDLICYRAANPEKLIAAQATAWNPVLMWLKEQEIAFLTHIGVMFQPQPENALQAFARFLKPLRAQPFVLTALQALITLTGSALLIVAGWQKFLTWDQVWDAAHVDERFQEEQWGVDDEALQRHGQRRHDFKILTDVLRNAIVA